MHIARVHTVRPFLSVSCYTAAWSLAYNSFRVRLGTLFKAHCQITQDEYLLQYFSCSATA